jgi:hypothetical protein
VSQANQRRVFEFHGVKDIRFDLTLINVNIRLLGWPSFLLRSTLFFNMQQNWVVGLDWLLALAQNRVAADASLPAVSPTFVAL